MNENTNALRVADLDSDDKPREKALKHGIGVLTNAELIAIVLGSGLPGKSVISLSQEMLNRADNNLYKLSKLTIQQLCKSFKGVGPAKAISLAAAFELGTRCNTTMEDLDPVCRSSKDAYNLMRQQLQRLTVEEFWVLHLSRSGRLISKQLISRGGTSATVVDVKIVIKGALENLASTIILVHNHPSGNLVPSPQDDALTQRIKKAAELMEIKVVDHIVIAQGGFYSYADEGRL